MGERVKQTTWLALLMLALHSGGVPEMCALIIRMDLAFVQLQVLVGSEAEMAFADRPSTPNFESISKIVWGMLPEIRFRYNSSTDKV